MPTQVESLHRGPQKYKKKKHVPFADVLVDLEAFLEFATYSFVVSSFFELLLLRFGLGLGMFVPKERHISKRFK